MNFIKRMLAAVHAFLYPPQGAHAAATFFDATESAPKPRPATSPEDTVCDIWDARLVPPWMDTTLPDDTGARSIIAMTPQQFIQVRER